MADALDSESSARKGVEVQVLSRANQIKPRANWRAVFLFSHQGHGEHTKGTKKHEKINL